MKKFGKIWFTVWAAFVMALMLALSGCCFLADERADVVFVSDAGIPVGSVSLTSAASTEVSQYADNSLLVRGGSLAFQVEEYPVTITVYGDVGGRQELASQAIAEAPEGGRWYVIARSGENGMALEVSERWPYG